MNNNQVRNIKDSSVWNQNFKNWDDILDNGILKCKDIDLDDQAMISILRSGKLVEDIFNEFLKHFDLSIAQQSILETLYFCNKDSLTQNELSNWVYSSKANISTLITRMEEKGLIKRTDNPLNKREKLVSITKIGEKKLEEVFEFHSSQKTSLFSIEDAQFLIKSLLDFRNKIKSMHMK